MTSTIYLERVRYKKEIKIAARFPFNQELINYIKKVEKSQWSYSQKAWLLPDSKEKVNELLHTMKGIARVDYRQLSEPIPEVESKKKSIDLPALSDEAKLKIEKFKRWMYSRRYSESTINTYTEALIIFLRFHSDKKVEEITNEDLIKFNNDYILKNKLSASYQNQVVNGVKLFFRIIEETRIEVQLIHRPKTQKLLPNVLSKEEVKAILNAPFNLKHRAMLSLIYSCGLRRSELLKMRLTDIDENRNRIIIRQAKGRKDRMVPLSNKIKELLQSYYIAYQPKEYVFEGQFGGMYSEKSLESVLKQSLQKAKINRKVSLHWLRHSYATHLLESGTDLRYIQELLGHSSSRTTEIYTYVSTKSLQNVRSPFDDL